MVEILNENDVFSDLYAWQVLMNLVWYYLVLVLLRLVLGLRRHGLVGGPQLLHRLVNHYVLRFRGRILFPADLTGWKTAANVAGALTLPWTPPCRTPRSCWWPICSWCGCAPPRPGASHSLVPKLILVAVEVGYTFAFFFTGMLPALGIYTQQWVTQPTDFC